MRFISMLIVKIFGHKTRLFRLYAYDLYNITFAIHRIPHKRYFGTREHDATSGGIGQADCSAWMAASTSAFIQREPRMPVRPAMMRAGVQVIKMARPSSCPAKLWAKCCPWVGSKL